MTAIATVILVLFCRLQSPSEFERFRQLGCLSAQLNFTELVRSSNDLTVFVGKSRQSSDNIQVLYFSICQGPENRARLMGK